MRKTLPILLATVVLTVMAALDSTAQQIPLTNFYQFNPYLFHPGYAGHNGMLEGTLSHRLQWLGVDGAPTTSYLGLHTRIGKKMGLGARFTLDETDILQRFSGALSYSYRAKLGKDHYLAFGLSGLIFQNSINLNDAIVNDATDDLVISGKQSSMAFDAEAGLFYTWKALNVGFTSTQLLESGIKHDIGSDQGELVLQRHFIGTASYDITLSKSLTLQPAVVIRNQQSGSTQVDGLALLEWQETVYLGGGYRQDAGPMALVGARIADRILMAYSVEFAGNGIAGQSNGTHEFMLGLRLGKGNENLPDEVAENDPPLVVPPAEPTPPEVPEVPEVVAAPPVEEVVEKIVPEQPVEPVVETPAPTAPVEPVEKVAEVPTETPPTKEPVVEKKAPTPPAFDASLFDQTVQFELDEAGLNQQSKTLLDKMAKALKEDPSMKLLVSGHACDLGGDAINQIVSQARAQTVRNYLVSKGVVKDRISIKAESDKRPLVPNTSDANRQKNRRTDFKLLK